jgi:hypothetical protein
MEWIIGIIVVFVFLIIICTLVSSASSAKEKERVDFLNKNGVDVVARVIRVDDRGHVTNTRTNSEGDITSEDWVSKPVSIVKWKNPKTGKSYTAQLPYESRKGTELPFKIDPNNPRNYIYDPSMLSRSKGSFPGGCLTLVVIAIVILVFYFMSVH